MLRPTITDFSKRQGSPFTAKNIEQQVLVHEEKLDRSPYDRQKEKQNELQEIINKKTAEIQSNKRGSDGCFTEVVSHGAFTSKSRSATPPKSRSPTGIENGNKTLLGFPSSANDLALEAKSDLESDPNISDEVKEKVIEKLFKLVSMVQHTYESKVRVMTDFEKFKDVHLKQELRREKEHNEQLYRLNMNYQAEVVQALQQLKREFDMSKNVSANEETKLVKIEDASKTVVESQNKDLPGLDT